MLAGLYWMSKNGFYPLSVPSFSFLGDVNFESARLISDFEGSESSL